MVDLSSPAVQSEFALMVGVSRQRIGQLVAEGTFHAGGTYLEWLHAYVNRLREHAAELASGEIGGLDLVQERAALAREQRFGYEIKNAGAFGSHAPIEVLTSVLAAVSRAVAERFDMLPGQIKEACPDLPDTVRNQIDTTIAEARSEWVSSTASLVVNQVLAEEPDSQVQPESIR